MSKYLLITAAAMLALFGVQSQEPSPRGGQPTTATVCDGAIQHPLSARITALDPIRRGDLVRFRVDVASNAAFEEVRVRLADSGGAVSLGASTRSLGAMTAGSKGFSDFSVQVPTKAQRTLLQFSVQGEGSSGVLTRGATFNILPDGPADPGRLVSRGDGTTVREYAAKGVR